MMGDLKAFDLLERISEADESRCMPRCSPSSECKRAIVVTATHTESDTAGIETDEGKEHDIEPACTQCTWAFRFMYPKTVAPLAPCQLDKTHTAAE